MADPRAARVLPSIRQIYQAAVELDMWSEFVAAPAEELGGPAVVMNLEVPGAPADPLPWDLERVSTERFTSSDEPGHSIEEAAAIRGVTIHTARSQIKNIFAKTGVHRQSDLVRLILGSVMSLRRDPPRTAIEIALAAATRHPACEAGTLAVSVARFDSQLGL